MPDDLRPNLALQVIILLLGAVVVLGGSLPGQLELSPLWSGIGTGLVAAGSVSLLQLTVVGDPFRRLMRQLEQVGTNVETQIVSVSAVLRDSSQLQVERMWHSRTQAEREWDDTWSPMLRQAQAIDIAAYAAEFLLQDEGQVLQTALERGAALRILLSDPTSEALEARDREAAHRSGLPGRVHASLAAVQRLASALPPAVAERLEVRLFRAPLYCSVYRADNGMFVTLSQYGSSGASAPTLQLRGGTQGTEPTLFSSYLAHFEALWASATALELVPD